MCTNRAFPNDCRHTEEEFYGTVEIDGKKYDLYFFHDNYKGYEYCLRYGEMGDYSSFPIDILFNFVKKGDSRERDLVIIGCFIDHINKLHQEK
jgi:hypothetical protein